MPDGMALVLRKDFGDADTRKVTTGREYLDAMAEGYGAYTTYDMMSAAWFMVTVDTLIHTGKGRSSVVSYVGDFEFGTNALSELPCTLNPTWNQYLKCALDAGQTFPDLPADWEKTADEWDFVSCGNSSPRYPALFPDATISNVSPEEVVISELDEDGYGLITTLRLAAWGDFNGDGIEDLLFQQLNGYRGARAVTTTTPCLRG